MPRGICCVPIDLSPSHSTRKFRAKDADRRASFGQAVGKQVRPSKIGRLMLFPEHVTMRQISRFPTAICGGEYHVQEKRSPGTSIMPSRIAHALTVAQAGALDRPVNVQPT